MKRATPRADLLALGVTLALYVAAQPLALPRLFPKLLVSHPVLTCLPQSFADFVRNPGPATAAGDRNTSGNGSIMRLAPVPIRYAREDDRHAALETAWAQSKTTHQGPLRKKGLLLNCGGDFLSLEAKAMRDGTTAYYSPRSMGLFPRG
jgi:hypothetical protein